jgi:hypothetical protein
MTTWTRIADPLADAALLPAWFVAAMMAPAEGGGGRRRGFGLLLATGDVLRVASLAAAHPSSEGTVLLDVVLDHAGVPDDVDAAWRSKHYLGARPVPGAVRATVNLAQVVAVVAVAPEPGERPERASDAASAVAEAEPGAAATVEGLRRAAEDAASEGRRSDGET